jgi:DNA invertase Pin-like site-specific DNA recombinase
VSTDASDQKHSFQVQKAHFMSLYGRSADYELVGLYADMGISGTKADIRPEFQRMLDDCRRGRIDRVVCKSISRFARNTKDCLVTLRELKKLGISVAFEKECIDTARVSDEIMITIMEGLAQEESGSISRNIRWSLKRCMANGTLKVARVPFGYTKDENRNLVIDEPKAAIVRRIFDLYLSGIGYRGIAIQLNLDSIPSPTGKQWNNITIKKILKQEKYIGDIHWQKTYGVFMGKQWQINRGNVDSYYIENAHPAIIDRETFFLAQKLIEEMQEKTKPKEENAPCDDVFRTKIRCTCGRSYYRVKAKNDYWQCIARTDISKPCGNGIFYDTELNAAWNRLCFKLKMHADEILTPVLVQLDVMKKSVQGREIEALQLQSDDLRQRRYMICKLCAEGCIPHEKMMTEEHEIDTELQHISEMIARLQDLADDSAEQIESLYNAVSFMQPEMLAERFLDHAVTDGNTITFYLSGGLHFTERLV